MLQFGTENHVQLLVQRTVHIIVWHFMGNVSKRLTHNNVIGSEKTNHFRQSITFYFLPFSKKKKKKKNYTLYIIIIVIAFQV